MPSVAVFGRAIQAELGWEVERMECELGHSMNEGELNSSMGLMDLHHAPQQFLGFHVLEFHGHRRFASLVPHGLHFTASYGRLLEGGISEGSGNRSGSKP